MAAKLVYTYTTPASIGTSPSFFDLSNFQDDNGNPPPLQGDFHQLEITVQGGDGTQILANMRAPGGASGNVVASYPDLVDDPFNFADGPLQYNAASLVDGGVNVAVDTGSNTSVLIELTLSSYLWD